MTEEDVLFQQRIRELSEQDHATKVTKGKDKVTDAQIAAYYNKNKARFAQPERRDLRIVLTKNKAKAEQAKKALETGQSLEGGGQEVLDRPGLQGAGRQAARRGQGPAGEGASTRRSSRPRRASSRARSRRSSASTSSRSRRSRRPRSRRSTSPRPRSSRCSPRRTSRRRSTTFVKDFRKHCKDKTDCREGYVVDDCKNAPKKKATTTTAPRRRRAAAAAQTDQHRAVAPRAGGDV